MSHALRTLSCCLLLAGASEGSAAPYSPQVGRSHPDFTLPSIANGKPIALSHFRGRKVLLVHFASW